MKHKKIIKLLLFNMLCIQAFGQSIMLQGLTKDDNDNKLPYVSFFSKNKFVGMSNELGEFNFQLADSLKFDSIKCTYLGYHPVTRSVIEFSFSSNNLLMFKKTSFSLSSVLIKSKKQYVFDGTKILGAKRNKPQGKYYLNNGHLVGTLIKNNLSKVAFIKNAYFT